MGDIIPAGRGIGGGTAAPPPSTSELLALEPRLLGLALRLAGEPHAAADLVQETYLRAFDALPRFRGEAPLWHWLARILVNRWKSGLRRDPPGALPAELPGGLPRALAELAGDELALRLELALQRLSPLQRATLLLRGREGWSYAEISTALGISLESVKVHLHHARQRLIQAGLVS